MNKIIELKNVTKRFGGITALNSASLHVNKGEVVGLELLDYRPDWEYKTPKQRDSWPR